MENVLPLFLFAYGDLRILPHPDLKWPPSWLAIWFVGNPLTMEQTWNIILGIFVLGGWTHECFGIFLILLGLRIWGYLFILAHPVPRYKLALPLVLSMYGYSRIHIYWADLSFLAILGSLLCFSFYVTRIVKRPKPTTTRKPPPTHAAYAVLRQASHLNPKGKFNE